jgi:uncharacterized protein YybS (DUF2232 family)
MIKPRAARTRSLAEGALLAAIAVILALAGMYLPLVGILAVMTGPVPILLAQLRHGLRLSLLVVTVTGLLLAGGIGLVPALGLVFTLGPLGIVLGEAFRRGASPGATLAAASGAALVSNLFSLAMTLLVMGQNPLHLYRTAFEEGLELSAQLYARMGMDVAAALGPLQEQMQLLLGLLFPFTLVAAAVTLGGLNYGMAALVLRRLGHPVGAFPAFASWRLPQQAWLILLISIALLYVDRGRGGLAHAAGSNIMLAGQFAFLVSGLAVIYWWLSRFRLNRLAKAAVVAYVFAVPPLSTLAMLIGLMDNVLDWRKLRSAGKEGGGRT